MSLDLQKVKSLPVQKSLLLINNFVINTTNFLNAFAETCEKKISQVSSKATELEIMLAVLEAKLNSIPDLDVVSTPPPQVQAAPSSSSQAQEQAPSPQPVDTATAPAPSSSAAAAPEAEATQTAGMLAKDDPAYEPFFKMLRVGVPMPVVQMKCTAAGLNGGLLETPDAVVSTSTPNTIDSQVEIDTEQGATLAEESSPPGAAAAGGGTAAKDHPDYEPFFKMLRVGVPMPVVQMKCSAAGLDGSLIENPDTVVS